MIVPQLFDPRSIVVVGGSNDITKPGGKILKNIINGNYKERLLVVNLKETEVQGIPSYRNIEDLPEVDLAIIAIAAKYVPDTVDFLTKNKSTSAFIVISAGFSEESEEGKMLEERLVKTVNDVNGTLIGPNCTGILTPSHHSIFTEPIPKLDSQGSILVSGSGATACFIMEAGIPKGLSFSNVISVGNSAQIGVEEVVKHIDETFNPKTSSRILLLYIEHIDKPKMLLKHATSLIRKGCKIAAVKAGSSEAGSRAASSHTGALASSDVAIETLFEKAGIVRCHGREELITVASIFSYKELSGKNIAVITHAGGPAVMLTDSLAKGGLNVPEIKGDEAKELKELLFPGASVSNPIDFLATGTAEQLGLIIDFVDQKCDVIDAMVVIFGTPGLQKIFDVYEILHKKMREAKKPIFPVLPSLTTAREEIETFIAQGGVYFPDEVLLGKALSKVFYTSKPSVEQIEFPAINKKVIRQVIQRSENGYLSPENVRILLDAAGIPRVKEAIATTVEQAVVAAEMLSYPVAMKVVGPIHKSDVGGVAIHIKNSGEVTNEFNRMSQIPDTSAILLQPMLPGTELFAGAKFEPHFGHLILCGLGGVFIEVLKDVKASTSPVSKEEAFSMIKGLKGYEVIRGVRGKEGINEKLFAEIIWRLSALVETAPEIVEMDMNPLIGTEELIIAVDARINVQK